MLEKEEEEEEGGHRDGVRGVARNFCIGNLSQFSQLEWLCGTFLMGLCVCWGRGCRLVDFYISNLSQLEELYSTFLETNVSQSLCIESHIHSINIYSR